MHSFLAIQARVIFFKCIISMNNKFTSLELHWFKLWRLQRLQRKLKKEAAKQMNIMTPCNNAWHNSHPGQIFSTAKNNTIVHCIIKCCVFFKSFASYLNVFSCLRRSHKRRSHKKCVHCCMNSNNDGRRNNDDDHDDNNINNNNIYIAPSPLIVQGALN